MKRPKLWTPGDWNAFFGFGTNILVNLLVLTGLLRFVLHMPDEVVFGRILPACGLMLFTSTLYYAWLAYKLAKETGRDDVTALPSGTSVPHMFVVVFVIMLPIALKTGDPVKGWEAGLTWVFIQSFVLMVGGFIAPYIRKITPRAALLGTLAGVSIAFISLRPALEMFMTPVIGVVCFAIILASWFGGVRYFKGIPAGLIAIARCHRWVPPPSVSAMAEPKPRPLSFLFSSLTRRRARLAQPPTEPAIFNLRAVAPRHPDPPRAELPPITMAGAGARACLTRLREPPHAYSDSGARVPAPAARAVPPRATPPMAAISANHQVLYKTHDIEVGIT